MKKLMPFLVLWTLLPIRVHSSSLRPTDQITAVARTIYNDGNVAQPDSVRIQVFRNGTELFDAWYNTADAECTAVDGWLVFTDQLQDVDGAGGDGHYVILSRAYDSDSSLYTPIDIQHHDVGPWGEVDNLAGWNPATDTLMADVRQVSGDGAAADNFETMLDGTGGETLSLGQLVIVASGDNNAITATGSGSGEGLAVSGGATGHGAQFTGGAISGTGLVASADGGGHGADFVGVGTGADINADISGSVTPADTNLSGETLAVTPEHWSADDSAGFQGMPIDSASIAGAVWNTPQTNHTLAGTFGKYLDSEVSSIGAGAGAYSVTIAAHDTSADQMVSNVRLVVRNKNQSSLLAVVSTNSAGAATVNLDADSFVVVATAPGYLFTPFDTMVVTGPGTDTILGFHIDPGSPASPSLCRVYGFLYTVAGEPEKDAAVSAYLPKGVTHTGTLIVSPFAVSSTTDSTGYFYLDLIPSDSLSDDSDRYVITISRSDGSLLRKRILVPPAESWQLMW